MTLRDVSPIFGHEWSIKDSDPPDGHCDDDSCDNDRQSNEIMVGCVFTFTSNGGHNTPFWLNAICDTDVAHIDVSRVFCDETSCQGGVYLNEKSLSFYINILFT